LFSILYDLCTKIHHSKFLLYANGFKVHRDIKSVEDCKFLQIYIDSEQNWCAENYMKLKIHKTKIIYFTP
jgi:hypothetical protein